MTNEPDTPGHRPRHSASDQNMVSTAILPRIVDDEPPPAWPVQAAAEPNRAAAEPAPVAEPMVAPMPPAPPAVPDPLPVDPPAVPDPLPVDPPPQAVSAFAGPDLATTEPPARPAAVLEPTGAEIIWAIDPADDEPISAEPPSTAAPVAVDSVAEPAPQIGSAGRGWFEPIVSLPMPPPAPPAPTTPAPAPPAPTTAGPVPFTLPGPGPVPPFDASVAEPVLPQRIPMPGAFHSATTSAASGPSAPTDAAPVDGAPVDGAPVDGAPVDGAPSLPEADTAWMKISAPLPGAAPLNAGPIGTSPAGTGADPSNAGGPADPEATALIPRIPPAATPDSDATAVIPKVHVPPTGDVTMPANAPTVPSSDDKTAADAADASPRGVTVVPLRPVRTEEGYRSVYSDLTRTTPGSVIRSIVRAVGELCITLGMILLLFAAYEVWGKTAAVNAHQNDLNRQLAQEWNRPSPSTGPSPSASPTALPPPDGKAIARMYIPRMGKQWIVVQGVSQADIKLAPGHYPTSAMPGQIGNFSVAGHRTPAIFWDLDQVKIDDVVVLETKDNWYVYRTVQSHIVDPHAVQVVAPVPNQPGKTPTQAMLTITTCNPKFDNYERLVIHAVLDPTQTRTRDQGRPPVLGG
jgi:sortase A